MRWRAGIFALLVLTAACSAEGPIRPARLGVTAVAPAGTATLRLRLDDLFTGGRRLMAVSATRAKLTVSGPDLAPPFEQEVALGAEVRVDAVPAGSHRLVTVQALDGAGQAIAGGRHRAVLALGAGDNDVALSATSTLAGDVYAGLLALDAEKTGAVAKGLDLAAFNTALAAYPRALGAAHPALLDAAAIAAAIHAAGGTAPAAQAAFAPAPGRVVLRPKNWPAGLSATATLTDPVSAPMTLGHHPAVLAGVPAGAWTLTLTPLRPGLAPLTRAITVAAGGTLEVELTFGTSKALAPLPQAIGAAAHGVFTVAGKETLVVGVSRGAPADPTASEQPAANDYHDGQHHFGAAAGWTEGPGLESDVLSQVAIAHAGKLYVLGGNASMVIDPASASAPTALPPADVPEELSYAPYPAYPSYTPYPVYSDEPWETPAPEAVPSWWPSGYPTPNSSDYPELTASLAFEGTSGISLGGAIYVTGGDYNFGRLSQVLRYDPAAGTFTVEDVESSRYHRYAMAGGAIGGVWYLAGGTDSLGSQYQPPAVTNYLTAYVPAAGETPGRWRRLAGMPAARGGAAAAVVNGRLYVLGGHDAWGRAVNDVESYDPATDTWRVHPPLATRRAFAAAGVVGGKIVIAGGLDGFYEPFGAAPLASVEEVTP